MEQSKTQYLDILQVYRGIAALMVVIHHAVGSLRYYHNIHYPLLDNIGLFGKLGVDFFFILSGFIISYSAYHKYDNPNSFKNYATNRLIRVYVPYLPIGILMYLICTHLPGFSNGNRELSLLTSLTLFPAGNPALSVAWTLTFELCFYLFFSISFYSKKIWNCFVIVWAILIIVFNYSALQIIVKHTPQFLKVFFSTYNIEFIVGYLLSLLVIHKVKISHKLLSLGVFIVLIFFLYLYFFPTQTIDFYMNYVFAGAIFFVLYVTITYFKNKINKNAIAMLIGNASYSIYLIHNPLQIILMRLYPKINSIESLLLALFLVLSISSLFGYLYYLIFEKKYMEIIKSKLTQ